MDTWLFDQQLFRAIYQSKDLISSSICHTEGGSLIWSDSTLARVGRCVNIVASPGKCAGNFDKTEELISSPTTTDQVVYVPLHDWHETSSNDMNHQGKRGDVSETCSLDTLISVCRREGATTTMKDACHMTPEIQRVVATYLGAKSKNCLIVCIGWNARNIDTEIRVQTNVVNQRLGLNNQLGAEPGTRGRVKSNTTDLV